jgi:hypothetical protein
MTTMQRLRDRAPEFGLAAFVIVAGMVAGAIGVRDPKLGALAVAILVVLLLVSRRPVALGIVTVAGVYAVQRLGTTHASPGTAGGISYSDALTAAASVLALPALASTTELRRLRAATGGVAVYLALLVPGLIASPSNRVFLEWTHRLVIVAGALVVGAWLVREHVERLALRMFAVVSVVVAIIAVYDSATNGFNPAFPIGLHKNFVGALFGGALVLLLAAPESVHVALALRFLAVTVIGLGLVASQSRGAELAAAAGVLIAFALNRTMHTARVKAFAVAVGVALAVVAGLSIRDQFNLGKADLSNSSAGVRVNVEKVTRDIWHTSPMVGVGLKYYNSGNFGRFAVAPTNVIDNELAESGVIGLIGFVVFQVGVFAAGISRRGTPLVAAAVGMVGAQLLHGMVDIYWSGGVVTLPFLVLGIALSGSPTAAFRTRSSPRPAIGTHRAA